MQVGEVTTETVVDEHHVPGPGIDFVNGFESLAELECGIGDGVASRVGKDPELEFAAESRIGFDGRHNRYPHLRHRHEAVDKDDWGFIAIIGLDQEEAFLLQMTLRAEHSKNAQVARVRIITERGSEIGGQWTLRSCDQCRVPFYWIIQREDRSNRTAGSRWPGKVHDCCHGRRNTDPR